MPIHHSSRAGRNPENDDTRHRSGRLQDAVQFITANASEVTVLHD